MSDRTPVTGKRLYPTAPGNHDFNIEDIAHALSLIDCVNGRGKSFYSVAQHGIACAEEAIARGCAWEVILGCLLHDAYKAYLSDGTRSVNRQRPPDLAAEEKLQNEIWKHFVGREFTEEELGQMNEIDGFMRSMEFHQLMPEDINDRYQQLITDVACVYRHPQQVSEQLIRMATLDIAVEQLLEDDYWIIDVFSAQMPVSRADEYFAVEEHYRNGDDLLQLFQRYAVVLCWLSKKYDTALLCLPESRWILSPQPSAIESAVAGHVKRGCVELLLPGEHTLFMLNGDSLSMTVYRPTEEVLAMLRPVIGEQGLYLWQTPQIERIKRYEHCFEEAKHLLHSACSGNESQRLHALVGELAAYYKSVTRREDLEADEAGLLPKNLKRGVLSKDGICRLLQEYGEAFA